MKRIFACSLFLLAAGCAPQQETGGANDAPPAAHAQDEGRAWALSPAEGAELRATGGGLVVMTGPHVIAWPAGAPPVRPPYSVRATLHKRAGRIHEGYGLIFGGEALDRPETSQAYSYFLVRGDGSFLIRRRDGASVPVLRGWTAHAAIRRDTEEGGRPNELQVDVGEDETVFSVNGQEVARLRSSELRVSGRAGLRIAHDVHLEVSGFGVEENGAQRGTT